MEAIILTPKNLELIQGMLFIEVFNIAEDIAFFEELDLNPKEYIDERIELYHKFDLDFWLIAENNCAEYYTKRLKALYEGRDMNEFYASYGIQKKIFMLNPFYN